MRHHILALIVGAAALAISGPAVAGGIKDGTYSAKGTTYDGHNGTPYTGTVTIKTKGKVTTVTRQTPAGSSQGVGFKRGKYLFVAYGAGSGLVVYAANKKRSKLKGVWTMVGGKGKVGTENAVGPGGDLDNDASSFESKYKIVGTNPGKKGKYKGTIEVWYGRGSYSVDWDVAGQKYQGLGDSRGDYFAVQFGGNESSKLFVYEQLPGGKIRGYETVVDPRGDSGDDEMLSPGGAAAKALSPAQHFVAWANGACACGGKVCAKNQLGIFKTMVKKYAAAQASKDDLKRIEKATTRGVTCLIQKGVTQQELERALK